MSKIAVFGAGSWGTAFSLVLADAGNDVVLWARREELSDAINSEHENRDYLPGVALADAISASPQLVPPSISDIAELARVLPRKKSVLTVSRPTCPTCPTCPIICLNDPSDRRAHRSRRAQIQLPSHRSTFER